MTVAKSVPFQADVYAVVSDAVVVYGIPVFDHAPSNPPNEFVRLDGFNLTNIDSKRDEMARHSFEVHHFLTPTATDMFMRGQTRAKTVLATIHAAIMAAEFQGAPINHEYLTVDSDVDGVTSHGVSRYTAVIV